MKKPRHRGETRQGRNWFDWGFRGAPRRRHHGRGTHRPAASVWETGKFSNAPEIGLDIWFIRGGSAGAALYKFLQPGIYAYVTQNLIEAADLGATAHFKVEGKWNGDLMTQVKAPAEIPAPNTN